jgi:hypothetical protein
MKTLQINEQDARRLYPTSSPEMKEIFEQTFGKDFLIEKIIDRIKTFEDACDALNYDPKLFIFTTDEPDVVAYKKLKVIVKALNEGWTPDWNDGDQKKWWPYFLMSSRFGFSRSAYGCTYSYSGVGSRLCFRTEELSNYAALQFSEVYKDFLT